MVVVFSFSLSGQSFQQSPSIFCSEPPDLSLTEQPHYFVAGEPAELQASIEGTQPISVQ